AALMALPSCVLVFARRIERDKESHFSFERVGGFDGRFWRTPAIVVEDHLHWQSAGSQLKTSSHLETREAEPLEMNVRVFIDVGKGNAKAPLPDLCAR